jgi:acetyltransferase-like isoleucine patch superfamily enzyme
LALARLLLALPDLHRLPPYWRMLRRLRVRALHTLHPEVSLSAIVHQGVYAHRGITLSLGSGAEIRDRVRLGIDESGVQTSRFTLGAGALVLSDTHVDCSAPVTIGKGTHVGRRNQLFTHRHDTGRRDVPVLDAPITTAPITIGDDVMLYHEVVVLPGVTIGDGAVVGIRSVVTRDVPPYAKVAGIPARIIGERA